MKLISSNLNKDELLKQETLFHTANGYFGVRGNLEEGTDDLRSVRGCYVNGFYDTVGLSYPERLYGFPQHVQRMINLPDVQTMKIHINGKPPDNPVEYERILDTSQGVTVRRLKYAIDSGFVTVKITRMASFTHPELFLTILNVESDNVFGELKITAGIDCNVQNYTNPDDPRVAAESIKHLSVIKVQDLPDGGFVHCNTAGSSLEIAVVQRYRADNAQIEAKALDNELAIELTAGINTTIEKYTIVSDSRRHSDPVRHALETAEKCLLAGTKDLLKKQLEYLYDFWKVATIKTEASQDIQDALEFNLYQLLQSTGQDGLSSVAAKGISGEGYEGHYFWDSEIYIFPFFLFTKPEIARAMLDYRYSILDGAREHAVIMGHKKGALYPWRTISGSECSSYFPSGSAQYHINGDIAHAFMQYWYATADLDYMSKKGAEVLVETARLWLDVGHYDSSGRFLIHSVTGPDEYTCVINNNYYTNRCAQANLKNAAEICKILWQRNAAGDVEKNTGITAREAEEFIKASEAMWLPYDAQRDIHAQDDSFLEKPIWDLSKTPAEKFPLLLNYHPLHLYRHQVCKQADTVLAHILFDDGIAESTKRNTYEYYERITTHDSSLSRCAFCIMAAHLGKEDKAFDYYTDILRTDLEDTHGNVKDGLHTANLGGSWLAMVMGFAGMRLNEKGLSFKFTQSENWEYTTFRIKYLGRLLCIHMSRDNSKVELEDGSPLEISISGRHCLIKPD
jgi:alpha,alpha-trehalose phosphorylase